jgi:hypothetical protein
MKEIKLKFSFVLNLFLLEKEIYLLFISEILEFDYFQRENDNLGIDFPFFNI